MTTRNSDLGIEYTCQKCLKRKSTTMSRSLYSKSYQGPCGDSFCYASCDMDTCRPMQVTVCSDCADKLGTSTPKRK